MKNRKQKVVINNKTTLSEVVLAGVPQGSIDRPLLFSLFKNDLILFLYTHNMQMDTQMTTNFILPVMIKRKLRALAEDFQVVINWFYENYTILNIGKCHIMCMSKDVDENQTFQILS